MLDSIADDPTSEIRRQIGLVLNERRWNRAQLEPVFGRVWDATELAAEFEIVGFRAPFVVVRRHADGQVGSLLFAHESRFYFAYVADSQA